MGISTEPSDSEAGSFPVDRKSSLTATSSGSKAAETREYNNHQNNMATIADDDDRLLVRIGYTPVRSLQNVSSGKR